MIEHSRIPLLKDHHNHLSFYALLHDGLNLQNVTEKAEAADSIKSLSPEPVSVVLGWNSGYYRFSEEELAQFPPVIIVNISLHSFLISPSAEARLKPRYPEIIANYRDPEWFEYHMPQMLVFAAQQVEPTAEKIGNFFDFLLKRGVYYAEDMLFPSDDFYRILRGTPYIERTAAWTTPDTFKQLSPGTRSFIRGIKLFTDGAVGARSAAMEQPFKDAPKVPLLYNDAQMEHMMREAASFGKSISIHAIGDVATAQAVRLVRKLSGDGVTFPLVRLEHCQFIHETTARRAKDSGIVLSMQPNFNTDSAMYTDRLLPGQLEANNPFRMLIDAAGFVPGEDLIFGSDGMPHGARDALQAALFPPYPGQRLSLREFAAGYCMPDHSAGHIEVEINKKTVKILSKAFDSF